MPKGDELAPMNSPEAAEYGRGYALNTTVDIEAADSFAYLRANWDILVKHRWLILTIAFVLTTLETIYCYRVQPLYESGARIEVEAETPFIQTLNDMFRATGEPGDETFLATQVSLLESDNLIWQTVQELGMANLPQLRGGAASNGRVGIQSDVRARLIGAFKGELHVAVKKGTRMIEVSLRSPSPELAARAVNTLVNDYIEYNFRKKYDATRQASGWMEQQLTDIKVKVEKSQQAMVDYERQNNIVNIGDRQSVAETRLQALAGDLTVAQSDRLQKQSLYDTVKSDVTQIDFIRRSPLLDGLETKEAALNEQYVDDLGRYGRNYPAVIRLAAQVKDLQTRIAGERKRIVESIHNDYVTAIARERLLADAVAQEKVEVSRIDQLLIQHNLLKREFESNQQLYDNLLQHLKDANVSAGLRATNIHLIDQAYPAGAPVWPQKQKSIFFALLAGLAIGVVLAFAREALDNTIKSAQEVEKLISAPALAIIPAQSASVQRYGYGLLRVRSRRKSEQDGKPELAVLHTPGSAISEAFRALRTSVLLSTAGHPPQALLVTSPQPNEGKTVTTLNLGCTLAQQGSRVLLLDSDLRRPGIGKALRVAYGKGLSGILTGAYEVDEALSQHPDLQTLWVLPAGPLPPNPAELLCSPKMGALLSSLRERFDHVILDSPPVLPITDATILSSLVDGVVMVVECEGTTRAALARACRVIEHSGGKILGTVLNKVDNRRDGYYGHYHYYYGYYSYRPGEYYGHGERGDGDAHQ
jgi:succinoglycan biosynthesis transport protein ExoP